VDATVHGTRMARTSPDVAGVLLHPRRLREKGSGEFSIRSGFFIGAEK